MIRPGLRLSLLAVARAKPATAQPQQVFREFAEILERAFGRPAGSTVSPDSGSRNKRNTHVRHADPHVDA